MDKIHPSREKVNGNDRTATPIMVLAMVKVVAMTYFLSTLVNFVAIEEMEFINLVHTDEI